MKSILAIALIAIFLSACTSSSGSSAMTNRRAAATGLTEDEKHRLYTAALAASESPLDNDLFKDVCKKIGIFDADGKPNAQYMAFVAQHVDWGMNPENGQFRREINTREKAREYVSKYLPR